MRKLIPAFVLAFVLGSAAISQSMLVCPTVPCIVFDIEAIFRAGLIEAAQKGINVVTQSINENIYIVNRRLSSWADVLGYFIGREDTPYWRIFDWFNESAVFFARDFHKTLSYGSDAEESFEGISLPRTEPTFDGLSADAETYIKSHLATIDMADAVITRSATASGALRYAGRAEDDAITELQTEVLDTYIDEQAMNAILGKLTAQTLIEARNAQSALTLQTALTELLVLDNKRARELETEVLNRRLNALQNREKMWTDEGSGEALRQWRIK